MFANALLSHSVFSNRTIIEPVSEKEVFCVEPEDVRDYMVLSICVDPKRCISLNGFKLDIISCS